LTRSDHDLFNDHVAVLVRRLGFDLGQLREHDARRLLADAWQRKLNDHEAAVAVGCGQVKMLLHCDVEQARMLLDRIGLVCSQWREDELVDGPLTTAFQQEAREALRLAH
jgi:hypothetical protein